MSEGPGGHDATRLADPGPTGTTWNVNRIGLASATAVVALFAVLSILNVDRLPALTPAIPLVLTVSAMAAATAGCLLTAAGRIHGIPALSWFGHGNMAAAVAMVLQIGGHPSIAPGGGLLGTDASGFAWLYLVWHLVIPLSVLCGYLGVGLRYRWVLLAATVPTAALVASSGLVTLPPLLDAEQAPTPTFVIMAGALSVLTAMSLWVWYRRSQQPGLAVEALVGAAVLLSLLDVVAHTVAVEQSAALWWISLGAMGTQFLVLSIGLMWNVTHIQDRLSTSVREAEQLTERSVEQAQTDDLTGLLNRRGTSSRVEAAFGSSPGPAAVLFVDLDNFKMVNDQLGHDAGDQMLKDVAEVLLGRTRGADVVGRWGGDEFVVVLPGTVSDVAEELRVRLSDALRRVANASIGCHAFDVGDGTSFAQALHKADQAMYRAKGTAEPTLLDDDRFSVVAEGVAPY